jgi:hypothetical protein
MHSLAFLRRCAVVAAVTLVAGAAPGLAAAPAAWIAVDSATLARHRGGLSTPAGLHVSLGVERLVSINGQLLSRTSFQIADIGMLGVEQARQTSAALSEVKLIQNGGDNMMLAGFSSDMLAGTVIQNTLSDQRIDSRTVISASVNSVGLLKTINFQGSLSDAIARAVVPR